MEISLHSTEFSIKQLQSHTSPTLVWVNITPYFPYLSSLATNASVLLLQTMTVRKNLYITYTNVVVLKYREKREQKNK